MLLKSKTIGLVALMAAATMTAPGALAQSRFQTPNGRQTIAPSQMPQQPMPAEDFAKGATGKVVPPSDLTSPGLPNFVAPTTGALPSQQPPSQGLLRDGAQPGALVLPQGIPSTVRTGPVEPISVVTRAVLAIWMLFIAGISILTAVLLQMRVIRDRNLYQGGHMIRQDFREEPLLKRPPLRRVS